MKKQTNAPKKCCNEAWKGPKVILAIKASENETQQYNTVYNQVDCKMNIESLELIQSFLSPV